MESSIYLDFNATTPMSAEVQKAVTDSMSTGWGNPSSSYATGRTAAKLVSEARESVGRMVGAELPEEEITFTSGGTESNHLALWSAINQFKCHGHPGNARPHVVTSNIEHVAIDLPLRQWESEGLIEVTFVEVDSKGRLNAKDALSAIKANTCLLSVMAANNETGVIQPITEICEGVRRHNKENDTKVLVHTDASQVFGKIGVQNIREKFPVDYLTVCGHKFYAPRIGALYHRRDTAPIHPLLFGGGQEFKRRPGTENTPMVVGLGKAAEMVTANSTSWIQTTAEVRDYLMDCLTAILGTEGVTRNFPGDVMQVLPNTLSVRFQGVEGFRILSECGGLIEASTASACHSGTAASASPVLLKSGLTVDQALSTIRLSVGVGTSMNDAKLAAEILGKAVKALQSRPKEACALKS